MTDVIVGRFALCDPIARGGSGVVWRAYDRKVGRFCAAKVLRRRDAGDLLRFVREQSFRLSHHHILAPYSWAAEDEHVVIASELVDGGSLSTLIGDYGPLSPATVATILDQVLEALEQVHAAGLVHRDVKPANLLLRATGREPLHAMLGDFGLAMGAQDAHLTDIGTVVGTPGYLAPEVMRGGVAPDARQDLFAAGRVAVALLNGVEPRDHTPVQPDTPLGPLRDLVVTLTSLDAGLRPTSATDARAGLRPILDAVTDVRPRTRGGETIDVLHQLPPLSQDALAEAGASGSHPANDVAVHPAGRPDGHTGPLGAGPPGSTGVFTPASAPRGVAPSGYQPTGPLFPGPYSTAPMPQPTPSARPRRSRVLLAVAALVAATAVAVPVVIAVHGASSPGSGTAAPGTIQVGKVCTWQEQGNVEIATDDTKVVCTSRDRTYVWSRP